MENNTGHLAFPERVEIVRMVDPPGCYDVWCDYSDGTSKVLNPTRYYGEECITWYIAGLKAAVLAAQMAYGHNVKIVVSTQFRPVSRGIQISRRPGVE